MPQAAAPRPNSKVSHEPAAADLPAVSTMAAVSLL